MNDVLQTETSGSAGDGASADQRFEVLVLSREDALCQSVRNAVRGAYPIVHATSLRKTIEAVQTGNVAVALTDATTKQRDFEKLRDTVAPYAPNLSWIIVADRGQTNDLLSMVNSGYIYRFLFRPVEEDQARRHITSAIKRAAKSTGSNLPILEEEPEESEEFVQEETFANEEFFDEDELESDPEGTSTSLIVVLLSALLGVGLAAGAAWMFIGYMNKDQAGPALRAAARDIEAIEALARAATAYQDGRYLEPEYDNALFYYQLVLEGEPKSEEANLGLDRLAQVYVRQLVTALEEERIDDAIAARLTVEQIRPEHEQLGVLDEELENYANISLGEAYQAIEVGEFELAETKIGLAARILSQEHEGILLINQTLEDVRTTSRIEELSALVRQRIRESRLTEPRNDNAKYYLNELAIIAPESEAFGQSQTALWSDFLNRARRAMSRAQFDSATRWINEARTLDADPEAITAAQRELAAAERDAAEEQAAALAQAKAAAEQTLQPEPETAAASEPETAEAMTVALADAETTDQPSDSSVDEDSTEAERPQGGGLLAALRSSLRGAPEETEQSSEPPPELVTMDALTIANYVAPRYPREANVAGVTGWVDLEFTVTESGETQDIDVIGADPKGYQFERAALSAVKKWEFRSPVVDGRPAKRRTRVRIDFSRE